MFFKENRCTHFIASSLATGVGESKGIRHYHYREGDFFLRCGVALTESFCEKEQYRTFSLKIKIDRKNFCEQDHRTQLHQG